MSSEEKVKTEKVKVKVKCESCGYEWMSGAKPENLKCSKCGSTDVQRDFSEPGFPNIPPSVGQAEPPKPKTLTVCGQTIPVRGGVAAEADPKVNRAKMKKRKQAQRLGIDEERI
jgi:predicted RNA-binding Zn-ribbon protein involved in translation (DUF1610 family)